MNEFQNSAMFSVMYRLKKQDASVVFIKGNQGIVVRGQSKGISIIIVISKKQTT